MVAVGTTVTRALETVADLNGSVHADSGWTDLVLGPHRPARVVTGLVTGWHEPQASHLLLLEAVAGPGLVQDAYAAALAERLPVARVRRQRAAAALSARAPSTRTPSSTGRTSRPRWDPMRQSAAGRGDGGGRRAGRPRGSTSPRP